ncbi:MAG: nucleoside triphosphate pyrophosphohydrolase [Mariprofundaceae bacterium]|nr:nucleoside triphosphate pyrophosphohydrolase [Mariprofundaceae bacterium]
MPDRIIHITNNFDKLYKLMNVLRKECSWDQAQTIESLKRYTLEETHEVLEAIDIVSKQGDWNPLLQELGDLLLQISFYACIAEEEKKFNWDDIVEALVAKMIYRHPHVFGDATPSDLNEQWESLKDSEHHERKSLMDGIPPLPALKYAQKQQDRAARIGFDWVKASDIMQKMREEMDELEFEIQSNAPLSRLEDEFGDVFFTLVNLARKLGLDSELCLMSTNRKFSKRFRGMEGLAESQNRSLKDMDTATLEQFYEDAKKELRSRDD